MRLQEVRRGRQCLRPEVCRTYNFGAVGASAGQFYMKYLRSVKLNDVAVPWTKTVRLPNGLPYVTHLNVLWRAWCARSYRSSRVKLLAQVLHV